MKNLHLLPTDNKSSRLYFNVNDKEFQICEIEKTSTILKPNRHIYITNDEEIKEVDWRYNSINNTVYQKKLDKISFAYEYKIILTTDQDLIKNGVQAIDDDFLEWFVKNQNCEEVKIGKGYFKNDYEQSFKIIIPKEEPKPHSFCETPNEKCTMNYCDDNGCQNRKRELVEPQQQGYSEEKLVEALQKISTGEIVGESKNHKDSLCIVKEIAKEAITEYIKNK